MTGLPGGVEPEDLARAIAAAGTASSTSPRDDPMKADLRALGEDFIKVTRLLLRKGTPQTKAQLVRAVVPAMIRAEVERDRESEELALLRAQHEELREAMRQQVGDASTQIAPEDVIPEDNAPDV